jgi:hypothetical protein
MNQAARNAEEQRPGVCHHEAAHAVFAYHAGQPIKYVTVGEDSEVESRIRYAQGDPGTTGKVVAQVLAGKYAEELAATGKPREHVPLEELLELLEEACRTDEWPEGFELDEFQALMMLIPLGRARIEGVYSEACLIADEGVERWWGEIDALASRLKKVGYLDGAEAAQVTRSASSQ